MLCNLSMDKAHKLWYTKYNKQGNEVNKMITFYKTISWGGMEGRTLEEDLFETEEFARQHAKDDTWNTGYELYKVTIEGTKAKTELIGKI